MTSATETLSASRRFKRTGSKKKAFCLDDVSGASLPLAGRRAARRRLPPHHAVRGYDG